jgi:Domain of unknown function (DUF222)
MFESTSVEVGTAGLAALISALADLDQDVDDSVRVDRIQLLEELKSAAAAAQARETAAFAESQQAAALGTRAEKHARRSVAAQVGLARRISPAQAAKYVGWARILTSELPNSYAALAAGQLSEWRALIVAKETIWLTREQRLQVDQELAARLESLGDRQLEAEARKAAYRLDPDGSLARARAAAHDRRVTVRPAPDTMARLTALLPVGQAIAAYAALSRAADTSSNGGDPRGRGQIMADTLVERLTGQTHAHDVPVEIHLVMTDRSLFNPDDTEPAQLDGYGPIPAGLARALALYGNDNTARWIRRLYTRPSTDELAAMDSKRRDFGPGQRLFHRLRDQHCRTPYCNAPIRHSDHIQPIEHGGPTSNDNGWGNCEACNYTKQAPGWRTVRIPSPDGRHEVEVITPTGHRYRSRPPDQPGHRPRIETDLTTLAQLLRHAAA